MLASAVLPPSFLSFLSPSIPLFPALPLSPFSCSHSPTGSQIGCLIQIKNNPGKTQSARRRKGGRIRVPRIAARWKRRKSSFHCVEGMPQACSGAQSLAATNETLVLRLNSPGEGADETALGREASWCRDNPLSSRQLTQHSPGGRLALAGTMSISPTCIFSSEAPDSSPAVPSFLDPVFTQHSHAACDRADSRAAPRGGGPVHHNSFQARRATPHHATIYFVAGWQLLGKSSFRTSSPLLRWRHTTPGAPSG